MEYPLSLWPGHHVEVVKVVTVGSSYWVIAFRHHHNIPIFDAHGFIETSVVCVHALKRKTLWWVEAMVVGFFQLGLVGNC